MGAEHFAANKSKHSTCAISLLGTAILKKQRTGEMSSKISLRFSLKEGNNGSHTLYHTLLSS